MNIKLIRLAKSCIFTHSAVEEFPIINLECFCPPAECKSNSHSLVTVYMPFDNGQVEYSCLFIASSLKQLPPTARNNAMRQFPVG